ncbi:hypothetical protein UJ101_00901 [Flavobacteriaceae bacterium UJ101]|nr:hypothetical protein UJ101_00901 [Flavobacteriaceae bacterium UJ101]
MKYFYSTWILFIFPLAMFSQVEIGANTLHTSTILDSASTSQRFLMSSLTVIERVDIYTSGKEWLIYNKTTDCIEVYTNSTWNCILQQVIDTSVFEISNDPILV